ncbi:MAG: UDP-N-acetylmuramoyl-tripeptide--D-alanyl-D-alanine ligase [Lysobacterales bacterium]
MLNLAARDVARWTGGRLVGPDATLASVSIDSRTLTPGALFVALHGTRHDGHAFVAQARARGAAAVLVARDPGDGLPAIVVADPLRALGELARAVRAQRRVRVAGITGSNGKTTVKTFAAAILGRCGRTHVNAGNFNNEIGLPLTVLGIPDDAEFAVLEMGAGKPGDIAYLARIAGPWIGLVNNVAPAHLERLGSLAGVADTKAAIYDALPAVGIAVINADDAYAPLFVERAGARRIIRFGLANPADVRAEGMQDSRFTLVTPAGRADVELHLAGRHNVMNALAAAAIGHAAGAPLAAIAAGLAEVVPAHGRLESRRLPDGTVLVDDSYNANPGSFAAAIALLAAAPGRRVLVMGDMAELGVDAERLHGEVGALARQAGLDALYATGPLSRHAVTAFGAGARHFPDPMALVAALRSECGDGATLLVKGSRASRMERVVEALAGGRNGNGGERDAA